MPQPKLELLQPPLVSRPVIRVSGVPLTPATAKALPGISTSEQRATHWLLYICRGRDSETTTQAVEKALGVNRS